MTYRRLVHNGTSFLLTIPPGIVQALDVKKGDLFSVELTGKGQIIAKPAIPKELKGGK